MPFPRAKPPHRVAAPPPTPSNQDVVLAAAVQGLLREPVIQYLCEALYSAQAFKPTDALLGQLLAGRMVPLGVPMPAIVSTQQTLTKRSLSSTSSQLSDASTVVCQHSGKRRRTEGGSKREEVEAAGTLQLMLRSC